ncbi:MAG: hypothetical protein ACYS32_11685 [Planctomycetota bacterium]|jgi:amino acid transporter
MQENTQNKPKLPLPKWCLFLLGVPTFYMPLMYLTTVASVIFVMLFDIEAEDVPEWLAIATYSAIYVVFVLWPVYIVWLAFSKRLALREKIFWLFVVTILNMLGMPMFYIFMIRRYLGLEGRIGKRDEAALDVLLRRCAISREQLSAGQLKILGTYCRRHRLNKWALVPLVAFAGLLIYVAIFIFPKHCITLHSDLTPTRIVIIDSTTNTREETTPDPEIEKFHLKSIMMFGAMSGAAGTMGIFMLTLVIFHLWCWHRRAFFDFLKATDKENSTSPST